MCVSTDDSNWSYDKETREKNSVKVLVYLCHTKHKQMIWYDMIVQMISNVKCQLKKNKSLNSFIPGAFKINPFIGNLRVFNEIQITGNVNIFCYLRSRLLILKCIK